MTSVTHNLNPKMPLELNTEGHTRMLEDAPNPKADGATLQFSAETVGDIQTTIPCEAKNVTLVPNQQHVKEGHLNETEKTKLDLSTTASLRSIDDWWTWFHRRYLASNHLIEHSPISYEPYYMDCFSFHTFHEDDVRKDWTALLGDDWLDCIPFPGPLVRGTTDDVHVYQYIITEWQRYLVEDNVIDSVGTDLVWRFLAFLWRKNGIASNRELAVLLLQQMQDSEGKNGICQLSRLVILDKKQEAISMAITQKEWEHLLILDNFYRGGRCGSCINKFIDNMEDGNPLKTIYLVRQGKIPNVALTMANWRPHLAAVLVHCSCPDLKKEIILMLADKLKEKGLFWSAHFCYMAIEMELGVHLENSRLILIGQDPSMSLEMFISDEAIHRTEIYEYLWTLSQEKHCLCFQDFKIIYARKQLAAGDLRQALKYMAAAAKVILATATVITPAMTSLLELSEKFIEKVPNWIRPLWLIYLRKKEQELRQAEGQQLDKHLCPVETVVTLHDRLLAFEALKLSGEEQESQKTLSQPPNNIPPSASSQKSIQDRPKKKSVFKRFWRRLFGCCRKAEE